MNRETQDTPIMNRYKEGMRLLTGAVCVIATNGKMGIGGMTATSVCSVSLEPPTLLVCINNLTPFNAIVKSNGVFSVNILKQEHKPLAELFAGVGKVPMEERFEKAFWEFPTEGVVRLRESLVSFECSISKIVELNTHAVVFGQVHQTLTDDGVLPLLYFDRCYTTLKP